MKKTNSKLPLSFLEVLKTSRPISWVNTAAPFFVGYLLSAQIIDWKLFFGTVYFLFSYNLLMYGVNDIFDYESDRLNPRKNSIEGGLLEKHKHKPLLYVILATNIPLLIFLWQNGNSSANITLLLTVIFALTYSVPPLRFKEVPVLDSINSAIHFVIPFIFGLFFGNTTNMYWPIIIAFTFWGMASQAFGAIQDIKPDRLAKIRSIATVLGAKRTARYSLILYITSSFIIMISYPPFGVIAGILLLVYALNVSFFLKYRSDANSGQFHRGWQNFLWLNAIAGFWLTQLLLIILDPFSVRPDMIALFGFFLIGLGIIQLANTVYNLVSFWRTKTKPMTEYPKISILMHAYNQADNISSTMLSLIGQQYPDFEIIFTDLGSKDTTAKIVRGYQDPRLKIVDIPPLKPGWTINAWASEQLLRHSTGQVIIVLSADTILLPNSLSIIAGLLEQNNLDLVSILPADQNKSLSQQIILSQNQFFLLGAYPSAGLVKTHPKAATAYSGIIAMRKKCARKLNGFSLVRNSPLEDFDLASAAKTHQMKTAFYLGGDIATSQNHASLRLIIAQSIRRYYPALHFSMPLTISLFSGGIVLFIVPTILICLLLSIGKYDGLFILSLATLFGYINRLIVTIAARQSILSTLLYPLGTFICLCMLMYSMFNYELLKPRWIKRTEVY